MLGLASKLRITPSVAIEQARLDMQFNRAHVSVAKHSERGDGYANELREFFAREYEAFTATLAEWSATRDAWIAARREQVAEQLERIDFTTYAREIEQRLRAQRRRVERMLLIAQTQNA